MGQEGLQIGAALGILNRSKKITNRGRDFKPDKEISNLGINYKSARKRLQNRVRISSWDRDYKSVQNNNSPSVMRFQASNDILFHWLKNWRSVWGQKNKLNICQVENGRMCCTAVKDKSNFSFIHTTYWQGRYLIFLKQWEFFWSAINKHWKHFSCSTSSRHSSYLLCFSLL